MYAVEFNTSSKDDVIYIPKKYRDEISNKEDIRLVVMYEGTKQNKTKKIKKSLCAISIDTMGYKFDRDEANER